MPSNFEATERELEALGPAAIGSSLGVVALTLAAELDDRNSATSKSLCAKAMIDVMREIKAAAPPKREEDDIERARKRRVSRLARQSTTGAASSS
jgi:hypothetical protein